MHPTAVQLMLAGCVLRPRTAKARGAAPLFIHRDRSSSMCLVNDIDPLVDGRTVGTMDENFQPMPQFRWQIKDLKIVWRSKLDSAVGELPWDEPQLVSVWPSLPAALVRRFIQEYR